MEFKIIKWKKVSYHFHSTDSNGIFTSILAQFIATYRNMLQWKDTWECLRASNEIIETLQCWGVHCLDFIHLYKLRSLDIGRLIPMTFVGLHLTHSVFAIYLFLCTSLQKLIHKLRQDVHGRNDLHVHRGFVQICSPEFWLSSWCILYRISVWNLLYTKVKMYIKITLNRSF